ncbi:hypothetical protein G6F42_018615 [Rhizopus arrhizus]|nr:hypothetical protein G6F42_018615 [Rhizopus arrhizus]
MSSEEAYSINSITYPIKSWIHNTAPQRSSLVHMASYMTIGTFTLVAISSLFCFFFVITLVDDCIRMVSPRRMITMTKNQIDWTGLIDVLSNQLTNFAEWEKRKRASWCPEDHPIYHEDRFHDLISAVTTYMYEYVHHRKQQEQRQQS